MNLKIQHSLIKQALHNHFKTLIRIIYYFLNYYFFKFIYGKTPLRKEQKKPEPKNKNRANFDKFEFYTILKLLRNTKLFEVDKTVKDYKFLVHKRQP